MTQKIQIWYLIGGLWQGGAEKTLVDLANNLPEDEYDVTIWTIQDEGVLRDEIADHVTYRTMDASHKADVLAVARFLRTIRREQPDVLQSFLFFDNNLARIAGTVARSTTAITGVRSVPNQRPWTREAVDRVLLGLSDHIVSNSHAGKRWIIERGAGPDSVSVIHNGRDLSEYADATGSPELIEELDLGDGSVVGTVGRLIERKGHYDLLEAWPEIVDSHPDATLLIIGDGPERDGLEETARRLGCADSVRFLGMRDDVPELLDVMDVFIFPSHFEGLPGALLEAMAAGLPIVCTPVDGNSELVKDGSSGVYISPHDSHAISQKILQLLSAETRAARLGQAAADRSKNHFTIQGMIDSFRELYETVDDR